MGVDIVGDIGIVRLDKASPGEKRRIAEAIMEETKTVRCVFEQEGGIEGDFRLRKLRHIAGERRTVTIHKENGCVYKVDVARCYFSPRLATERNRIADRTESGETVLNMFAGVGPFSIVIAKRKETKVLSCELSEVACKFHRDNNSSNKVERLVRVVNADALTLPKLTKRRFERILMPHPSQADRFLPAALAIAKKGATIHYYRHVLGRNEDEGRANLTEELDRLLPRRTECDIRRVREVGPRWLEMVADVKLA